MGYTFMSEIKGFRDDTKIEIEWRDGRVSLTTWDKIHNEYVEVELEQEKANEFIESFVAACKCANIELLNVDYK